MTPPPPHHAFVAGELDRSSPSGRTYVLCATCGRRNVGLVHGRRAEPVRGLDHVPGSPLAGRVARAPMPERPGERAARPEPAPPPRKVPDWRVRMLAHAVELVMEHRVELSAATELRVHELARALRSELYGTHRAELQDGEPPPIRVAPVVPVPPPPDVAGTSTRLGSSKVRGMLHGIRGDRQRELVKRALNAGWRWERTRGGHLKLYPPEGPFLSVSMTADSTNARSWDNLRATAARRGLDVSGL